MDYAVITPVRNEPDGVCRLAECLLAQSKRPTRWLLVDNGSTDETPRLIAELASKHEWIDVVTIAGEHASVRSGPVVHAFEAGVAALPTRSDVVVKLDADVSFGPTFFERLLDEFARDGSLGICGGLCYEEEAGEWRPRFVTRSHVRGATRAYRWACLVDVSPLEHQIGWDGVDELKAGLRGWTTRSLGDLPFYHHRPLGIRDGRRRAWEAQGAMAHFMGYRLSYLLARALYRSAREPVALAMLQGYASAVLHRAPRCSDDAVRAHLRAQQRASKLPLRVREALGKTR